MPETRAEPGRGAAADRDALDLRAIAIGAGSILATIAVTVGAAWLLLDAFTPAAGGGTAPAPGSPPHIAGAPVLEVDPAREIAAYREEKRRLLESYGWVDREHGIVRIPIERAMEALASGHAGPPR